MAHLSLSVHNASVLSNLKPGDLVEFPRGLYSHWAVYIGNEEVVHLAGVDDVGSGAHISASSFSIGGAMFSKAKVCRDNFRKVAAGCKALINNSKDGKDGKRAFSAEEIVKRAVERIDEEGYNLIWANCEIFANWCRYGISQSNQVDHLMTGAAFGLAAVATAGLVYALSKNDGNKEKEKQKVATKR